MNFRTRTAALTCCLVVSLGCKQAATGIPTGEWALTGVVVVTGRVLNAAGVPVDSFRVSGGVPNGGQALYSQGLTTLTGADGRYSLRVERSAGAPPISPDSVIMRVGAQSLKLADRNSDGTARIVAQEVWISFGPMTLTPAVYSVDFSVPVVR